VIGWVAAMERQLAEFMAAHLGESFTHQLPLSVRWGAALLMAFGLPLSILTSVDLCRRLILWIVSSIVMLAWAPVLCLAAYQPEVLLVVVVTLVAGGFAVLYAGCLRCSSDDLSSDSHEES
jgi:hypothetical protein